jgi:hypothetical protein
LGIERDQAALDAGGAGDGIHHSRKVDEQTVPDGLDAAAVVDRYGSIDEAPPHLAHGPQGADLILDHQAAIADHVGHHDRGELPLGEPLGHGMLPGSKATGSSDSTTPSSLVRMRAAGNRAAEK